MTNHGTGEWPKPLDKANEPVVFEALGYVAQRAQAFTELLLGIALTPAFTDPHSVGVLVESELTALTALVKLADPEPNYTMAGRYLNPDGAAGCIASAQSLARTVLMRLEVETTPAVPLAEALAPYAPGGERSNAPTTPPDGSHAWEAAENERTCGAPDCGRDNRNGTHDALEQTGHLSRPFTPSYPSKF